MVIPLEQCIARPDEGSEQYRLVDHLVSVATACGDPNGKYSDRLGFLAGLLHDIAKCHIDWQDYILPSSKKKMGPPHAPLGSAIFAFVADTLIPNWCSCCDEREAARDEMLNWLLAIRGHHGKIPDLTLMKVPWASNDNRLSVRSLYLGCDIKGTLGFVRRFYPVFDATPEDFFLWIDGFEADWVSTVDDRALLVKRGEPAEMAVCYAAIVSRLIVADRLHAGNFADSSIDADSASKAIKHLNTYCDIAAAKAISDAADPELVSRRANIQQDAIRRWYESPHEQLFTLLLPTGFGKTLTALRVALEMCTTVDVSRIIYVAPYLSILSQAAKELRNATGMQVFEHHHLSLLKYAVAEDKDDADSESMQHADDDFEALDTWLAPIVATTFNQFFRALFPKRAQHSLRVGALRNAVVIIDEPQIISGSAWNVFLRAADLFSEQHDCRIIFTTATLPPITTGLIRSPVPLAGDVQSINRYRIRYRSEPYHADSLAKQVVENSQGCESTAVVLNTVRDAAVVYQRTKATSGDSCQVYCLTALMLPSHKQRRIKEIRKHLDELRAGEPTGRLIAVCTQILEAGVDLSFRSIFRANSILPSIVQVAGRGNRHNEGKLADVNVFPFAGDDELDRRRYVYQDAIATDNTDRILADRVTIDEIEVADVLRDYFELCWQQNDQAASLELFRTAANGNWSELSSVEPFGFSPPREELFIPVPLKKLDRDGRHLVERFAPSANDFLYRFLNGDYRGGDFWEQKLVGIALRQFIVPTPRHLAERIGASVSDWLWKCDPEHYSEETGLAHLLVEESATAAMTSIIL